MKTMIISLDTDIYQPDRAEYDAMTGHMRTDKILVAPAKMVSHGRQLRNALICLVSTPEQEKVVCAIAGAYKQDTALEIEDSGLGYSRSLDDKPRQLLGKWREADPDVKDNFALNMNTMQVFTWG